jgi:hypothetical protein
MSRSEPSESRIQSELLLAAPQFGVRLWRFQTGTYQLPDGRYVSSGFPGAPDLLGIRLSDGKFIAVEVKSKTGRVGPHQAQFLAAIRGFNGIAGICRSVEDLEKLVTAD